MALDLVAPKLGNNRTFLIQSTGKKNYFLSSTIMPKKKNVIKKGKSTPCVEPVLILTKWGKASFITQVKIEYYICRRERERG